MQIFEKTFTELTTEELYRILQARVAVFVVEQTCPYPELDDKDQKSVHLWFEENGKITAYCRMLPAGVSYPEASIGRVLTIQRGTGLGAKLMEEAIPRLQSRFGPCDIRIEAQIYAREFYEKFGFVKDSEKFLEDGIEHIEMIRKI